MPKDGVELMPEPEDRAILTAVDRGAEGYTGEDYGLSDKRSERPEEANVHYGTIRMAIRSSRWSCQHRRNDVAMADDSTTHHAIPPASEWAYESSGVRLLGDEV